MARSSHDGVHACLLFHRQIFSGIVRKTEKIHASMAIRQSGGMWRIFSTANGHPVCTESKTLKGEMVPLHITAEMASIIHRWWERLITGGEVGYGRLTPEQSCLLACQQAGLFVFCDPERVSPEILRAMALARNEAMEC